MSAPSASEEGTRSPQAATRSQEEGSGGLSKAAGGRGLDRHTESSHPGLKCRRGDVGIWLLSSHGEMVCPCCGSVNKCEKALAVARQVKMQMLIEDAMAGNAPTILTVTTTRTSTLDMRGFYRARELVVRAIRRRWPDAEYDFELEFTTGYGPRAGGKRRPHGNTLWKNIPASCSDLVAEITARVWCQHVDALPEHQYCAPIATPAAAIKYLASHFTKASQRAPAGFTGHRSLSSRGYFPQGVVVARRQAKESLAARRIRHRAIDAGLQAHDVELVVHQEMRRAASTSWVLVNERGARMGAYGDHPGRTLLARARARSELPRPDGERVEAGPQRMARADVSRPGRRAPGSPPNRPPAGPRSVSIAGP